MISLTYGYDNEIKSIDEETINNIDLDSKINYILDRPLLIKKRKNKTSQ